MKSWSVALLAGFLWSLAPLACGTDTRVDSGTSTNWYSLCDESAECGSELACICGRCTRLCDDATDCEVGVCASRLASVVQCEGQEKGLLCMQPEPDSCNTLGVGQDETLAVAPAGDCASGALVCEGFNAPFPSEYSTWESSPTEQPVGSLQDCDVFSGEGALRVAGTAGDWWQTRIELPEVLETGEVHARFYAKVSSTHPLPNYLILLELWNGPEVTDDKISVELIAGDGLRLVLGPNGTQHGSEPGALPLDQWVCVELAIDLGAAGAAQLTLDGRPLIDLNELVTVPSAEAFSVVTFGAVASTDATGFDVLLDDLVVGSERVGCP